MAGAGVVKKARISQGPNWSLNKGQAKLKFDLKKI